MFLEQQCFCEISEGWPNFWWAIFLARLNSDMYHSLNRAAFFPVNPMTREREAVAGEFVGGLLAAIAVWN